MSTISLSSHPPAVIFKTYYNSGSIKKNDRQFSSLFLLLNKYKKKTKILKCQHNIINTLLLLHIIIITSYIDFFAILLSFFSSGGRSFGRLHQLVFLGSLWREICVTLGLYRLSRDERVVWTTGTKLETLCP